MTVTLDPHRLAALLDDLSATSEQLGSALCSDPALAAQHMVSLQGIDRLAQIQRALAQALRAADQVGALPDSGLDELHAWFS